MLRHWMGGVVVVAVVGCTTPLDDGADGDGADGGVTTTVGPARDCEVVVTATFDPGTDASIAGSFNDWQPEPMADDDGDGTFQVSLGQLSPGTWPYKFVYDVSTGSPVWGTPPPDVYTTWEGGVENRALVVGDCQVPSLKAVSATATAEGTLDATFAWLRGADGPDLDEDSVVVTVGGEPVEPQIDVASGTIRVSLTGLPEGKHSVKVTATDQGGTAPEEGQAFVPLWVEPEPFDYADGLMYYVFTDRFRDGGDDGFGDTPGAQWGTDYMGGDLVGALEAMEEGWFEEANVRSIWLSPVNENPEGAFPGSFDAQYTGYHGYWPIEQRQVEQRLGTLDIPSEQALHDFIEAAHDRGIRVLLDVVLNHVHEDHAFLVEHPDWFGAAPCPCTTDPGPCNWDSNPIYCWFTDYLPDLDMQNQAIVDRLVDDARWWVETFDVDGFRVDAAKHMHHVILRTLSMRMRDLYEIPNGLEFYLVGETFTFLGAQGLIMDYVAPWELDGQFDFPLYYAIRQSLLNNEWRTISNEAWAGKAVYGEHVHRMSPFMGNHDIPRFATDIQGCDDWALFGGCGDVMMTSPDTITGEQWNVINRMSAGFAVVVGMPGVPLLYYGDDVGLAGAGDPDNRRMMPWGELTAAQEEILGRIRALGRIRGEIDALQTGEWKELWVADGDDLFVFARDNGAGDVAIVAIRQDLTGGPRTQRVPLPAELQLDGTTLVDRLNGARSYDVVAGAVDLTLDPWEYVILTPQ